MFQSETALQEVVKRDPGVAAESGLGTTRKSLHKTVYEPNKTDKYHLQRHAQKLLPHESVSSCQRNLLAGSGVVEVVKTSSGCGYRGLFVCGSVWHCPVCASKIAAARSAEIQAGIVTHRARGGSNALLTLTIPHQHGDSIKELLVKKSKALQIFKNSRSYKRIMSAIGNKGDIRALEVTYSSRGAGFHPHSHAIYFGMAPDIVSLMEQLRPVWADSVRKAGLGEINEHGFDVKNGDFAADYIAKWGHEPLSPWRAGDELTRAHLKMSKKDRTPWMLLSDSMKGDSAAGRLFQAYAHAFKGKRQLYYSPGLKDYLAIEELTDDEIAEGLADQEIETVCKILPEEWRVVLGHNARGQVLDIANRHGAEGVRYLIEKLRGMPDFDSPYFDYGKDWSNFG